MDFYYFSAFVKHPDDNAICLHRMAVHLDGKSRNVL